MMGYGTVTKGYRLYDVTERKLMHSRNVQFNERNKDHEQDSEDATNNDYQLIAEFSEVSDIESDHYTTQSENNQSESGELRRSTRQRRQPDFYGRKHSNVYVVPTQPVSYQKATKGPDSKSGKLL